MATHSQGSSVTKTVSMDFKMADDAEARAKSIGFRSFSGYIQKLIRADLMAGGDLILKEESVNYGPQHTAHIGPQASHIPAADQAALKKISYLAPKRARTARISPSKSPRVSGAKTL